MLNQAFRERRIALGMTQDHAARFAGISRKTVSDFENNRGRITLGKLNRLFRAVGLELVAREASARPTLDELGDRYAADATPTRARRVRRRKPG